MNDFLADPLVRPLGPAPACAVAACAHLADGCRGWCGPHYARWRAAVAARPGLDAGRWQLTEPPVAEGGHVSLHGLPPLVAVQVLFGVWRRAQDGVKTGDVSLRAACRALARQQVTTVEDCHASQVASKAARALLRSFARDVRRALADPAAKQASDVWDLAVFGHRGRLDFAGITQPWLREAESVRDFVQGVIEISVSAGHRGWPRRGGGQDDHARQSGGASRGPGGGIFGGGPVR
jgi:hypothetical protein